MPAAASISRRQLLKGRPVPPPFAPRPPGITDASIDACTGCGECLGACPERILGLDAGRVILLAGQGECIFCGKCADACPEPVFGKVRVMAHHAEIGGDCLAALGVTCMSCRDICPEGAISMRPRIGGPFLPSLDAGTCSGCGACLGACPGAAIQLVPVAILPAEASDAG